MVSHGASTTSAEHAQMATTTIVFRALLVADTTMMGMLTNVAGTIITMVALLGVRMQPVTHVLTE